MIQRSEMLFEPKFISKVISDYAERGRWYDYLQAQYEGDQGILYKPTDSTGKPDKRLVDNFPGYISTVHTGYFMGIPVSYDCEDQAFLDKYLELCERNNEDEHNFEMAKNASKCGVAKEYLYIDEDAQVRFVEIEPEDLIVIRDDTVSHNIIGAIRKWLDSDDKMHVEVLDAQYRQEFIGNKNGGSLVPVGEPELHKFKDVPVNEYRNNKEGQGDYEKVLSLINEYDESQSESANDFAYFSDAYLAVYGASDSTEVESMRKNRLLFMPEGARAEWLMKNIQDAAQENHKNRLEADIHKFSFTPDLSDESFAGNTSGEAMKYKLWGLEQMAVQKERAFKKGLQRRIKLICGVWGLLSTEFDWSIMEITFHRNMPQVISDMAEVVSKLSGLVPQSKLLALLPFIDDADAAVAEMDEEKPVNLNEFEPVAQEVAPVTEPIILQPQ
jgi:SPP1 family phage portal protein